MAEPTEAEMMADLAAADAAGDTALAQHIAERIRAVRVPAKVEPPGTRNVPVSMLTGDPETDRRIAENLAQTDAAGRHYDKAITPEAADRALAISGGLGAAALASPVIGGGISSGLIGYGTSTAPTAGGRALDAGSQALVGAGLGYGVPKAIGAVANAIGPLAAKLDAAAVKYGRKAITGVSSPLARRKELPEAAVRAAFDVGAIRPLSSVEGIAARLQDPVEEFSTRYASILKELEARGVTGPNAQKLASQFAADASQAEANSIIGTRAVALQGTADALNSKALPIAGKGNLGLMQAELMKRELQNAAAGDFVKEGRLSLSGHARKEVAGRFRQAIEDSVAEQAAKAPAEAAEFQPVKERLSNLLQASGAANEAAARSARRSPFGLHEAMGLASGIATGNPIEAVGSMGLMSVLKDRGASTLASAANSGARALGGLPATAASSQSGDLAALIAALRAKRPALGYPGLGFVPGAAEETDAR